MSDIDATARVDASARVGPEVSLGARVVIGPGVIIEGEVTIGADTVIEPYCVLRGPTKIGERNHIYQFCSVGEACQDLKYHGEHTRLEIGDDNLIREHCTLHRGTVQDKGVTRVGSHNLLMVNTHIAHDCVIGDHCIFANNATMGGHVTFGDWAIMGGLAAVHQFGRVGAHAFLAGKAAVSQDVPPYVMAAGHYAKPFGINKEGLRRRGFTSEDIAAISRAYMILYKQGHALEEAIELIAAMVSEHPCLKILVDFLREHGRGIVR